MNGPEPRTGAVSGVRFSIAAPGARAVTLILLNTTSAAGQEYEVQAERRGDGTWTAAADLVPGEYRYFFVVDGSVTVKGVQGRFEEDDFGGVTGVLTVIQGPEGGLLAF